MKRHSPTGSVPALPIPPEAAQPVGRLQFLAVHSVQKWNYTAVNIFSYFKYISLLFFKSISDELHYDMSSRFDF